MALLGAAALMFFGPEQLPKVARKVGLLMRDVQNTSQTFIREMERAADVQDSGEVVSRANLLDETTPAYVAAPAYTPYDAAPAYTSYDEVATPAVHHAEDMHAAVPSAGHQPPP